MLPVAGLIGSQTGYPDFGAHERPFKRLYFPDMATGLPVFNRFVKTVDAFLQYKRFNITCIWKIYVYGIFITSYGSIQQLVGFRKQSACINGKNFYRYFIPGNGIGNNLVFLPER